MLIEKFLGNRVLRRFLSASCCHQICSQRPRLQTKLLAYILSVVMEHVINKAQCSHFLSILPWILPSVLMLHYTDARRNARTDFLSSSFCSQLQLSLLLLLQKSILLPSFLKIRRVSSSARCMAEAVMRDDAAGVQRKIQDKYPMPTTSTAVHIGSF